MFPQRSKEFRALLVSQPTLSNGEKMFAESTWRRRSHLKMANAGTFLFQYLDIAAIPTATAFKKGAKGVWWKTKTRCE